ncbi:hypothetical protein C8R45DRAFT_1031910 [Mycena sanguinolenta]|nr:hypothetical protein C8R45DRAFT_1031910 [Mycena sanguinolenta]
MCFLSRLPTLPSSLMLRVLSQVLKALNSCFPSPPQALQASFKDSRRLRFVHNVYSRPSHGDLLGGRCPHSSCSHLLFSFPSAPAQSSSAHH